MKLKDVLSLVRDVTTILLKLATLVLIVLKIVGEATNYNVSSLHA